MNNKKRNQIKSPNGFLIRMAKLYFTRYILLKKIKLTYDNSETRDIDGPFILLINHGSHLDSLLMYYTLFPKFKPYIVGAANLMSTPFKKFMLTKGGVIRKLQCQSDIGATRTMMTVVKNGNPLVLYPVGRLPSCGEGSTTNLALSKLIKKMKVPVVAYKIEGTSLIKPKWAKRIRKGTVKVKTSLLYSKEELESTSLEDIRDRVNNKLLKYNDYNRNIELKNTYKSKNKAEGLEDILYICPKCGRKYTTYTKGRHIKCFCGLDLTLTDESMFLDNEYFKHPNEWFNYQLNLVKKDINYFAYSLTSEVELEIIVGTKLIKKGSTGVAVLDKSGITYSGTYLKESKTFTIPINQLRSLPYTCNNNFEGVYDNSIIKFIPQNKRSVVEWSICSEALAKKGEF